jgi:hypothetical protein
MVQVPCKYHAMQLLTAQDLEPVFQLLQMLTINVCAILVTMEKNATGMQPIYND